MTELMCRRTKLMCMKTDSKLGWWNACKQPMWQETIDRIEAYHETKAGTNLALMGLNKTCALLSQQYTNMSTTWLEVNETLTLARLILIHKLREPPSSVSPIISHLTPVRGTSRIFISLCCWSCIAGQGNLTAPSLLCQFSAESKRRNNAMSVLETFYVCSGGVIVFSV